MNEVTLSNNLKQYIQTDCQSVKKKIHPHMSSMQSSFLDSLHDLFMKAHIKWMEVQKSNEITEVSSVSKGDDYSYIPENVRQIIEKSLKHHKTYNFTIHDRNITVSFFANANKTYSPKRWLEYTKKIFIWLSVISTFSSRNCVKHLHIYVYLTNEKKQIPRTSDVPIGRKHVNTAFTTSCTSNTEIHLFREEEWFKVFIHESFHSYGLDFSTMDTQSCDIKIKEVFGISTDSRLYESYTEAWAEIIYICFLVHFSMVSSPKWENPSLKYIKKIEEKLSYEIVFSLLQCIKVLKHNNISCREFFSFTKESKAKTIQLYKEDTPVFSYYIVKSVLLYYVNDFIEWTLVKNRGSINFHKTNTTIQSYISFIYNHFKESGYRESIEELEKCLQTNYPSFLNTMRMTLHDD